MGSLSNQLVSEFEARTVVSSGVMVVLVFLATHFDVARGAFGFSNLAWPPKTMALALREEIPAGTWRERVQGRQVVLAGDLLFFFFFGLIREYRARTEGLG
jgi:hypothetical protein